MSGHRADAVFAGSVPELYDTYMVPNNGVRFT